MIPDDVVEQVREAADIVGVIGEHVSLRRTGSDFRGPCPFHQGKHRNFSVSPRKRMYYCFVCHAGGDVFDFLQKRLGVDWPSAVRMVAEKSGIEVREVERHRTGPDPRDPLWEVNAAAAHFFQRTLWDDEAGQEARDYLRSRSIERELADRFTLGFAPRDPGALRGYLGSLGYEDERLIAAGLLVIRDDAAEPRPRFRGRLIFPILDVSNRHVGFGGRLLGPGEPKYLNSAESSVFSKGKLLYGLASGRHAIRREERVLVVEGYFDVVRAVGAGIEAVVAPLGTALTSDQAALLRRYTTNVFLLYDSDKAGLRATFRSADALLAHGAAVQVVTLPEGEDPDTYIVRHGREALERAIDASIDVFERKIQILERAGWFADLRRKRRALDRLLPTIRVTSDPLTRDLYVTRVSEAAGIGRDLLLRELQEEKPAAREEARATPTSITDAAGRVRRGDRRVESRQLGDTGERELVRTLLHSLVRVEALAERIGPESFRNRRYREIYQTMLTLGSDAPTDQVAARLSEDAIAVMQTLLDEPDAVIDVGRTIDDSLAAIRRRDVQDELDELDRLIGLAEGSEKDVQIRRKSELVKELRLLGGIGRHFGKSRS